MIWVGVAGLWIVASVTFALGTGRAIKIREERG